MYIDAIIIVADDDDDMVESNPLFYSSMLDFLVDSSMNMLKTRLPHIHMLIYMNINLLFGDT